MSAFRAVTIFCLLTTTDFGGFVHAASILDYNSSVLWRNWLLTEDDALPSHQQNNPVSRRITPKSVFIAPSFETCSEGYRYDGMGGCNKIVQVNPEAQWDFLLQKLNSMYAAATASATTVTTLTSGVETDKIRELQKPTATTYYSTTNDGEEKPEQPLAIEGNSGPFQLSIPFASTDNNTRNASYALLDDDTVIYDVVGSSTTKRNVTDNRDRWTTVNVDVRKKWPNLTNVPTSAGVVADDLNPRWSSSTAPPTAATPTSTSNADDGRDYYYFQRPPQPQAVSIAGSTASPGVVDESGVKDKHYYHFQRPQQAVSIAGSHFEDDSEKTTPSRVHVANVGDVARIPTTIGQQYTTGSKRYVQLAATMPAQSTRPGHKDRYDYDVANDKYLHPLVISNHSRDSDSSSDQHSVQFSSDIERIKFVPLKIKPVLNNINRDGNPNNDKIDSSGANVNKSGAWIQKGVSSTIAATEYDNRSPLTETTVLTNTQTWPFGQTTIGPSTSLPQPTSTSVPTISEYTEYYPTTASIANSFLDSDTEFPPTEISVVYYQTTAEYSTDCQTDPECSIAGKDGFKRKNPIDKATTTEEPLTFQWPPPAIRPSTNEATRSSTSVRFPEESSGKPITGGKDESPQDSLASDSLSSTDQRKANADKNTRVSVSTPEGSDSPEEYVYQDDEDAINGGENPRCDPSSYYYDPRKCFGYRIATTGSTTRGGGSKFSAVVAASLQHSSPLPVSYLYDSVKSENYVRFPEIPSRGSGPTFVRFPSRSRLPISPYDSDQSPVLGIRPSSSTNNGRINSWDTSWWTTWHTSRPQMMQIWPDTASSYSINNLNNYNSHTGTKPSSSVNRPHSQVTFNKISSKYNK